MDFNFNIEEINQIAEHKCDIKNCKDCLRAKVAIECTDLLYSMLIQKRAKRAFLMIDQQKEYQESLELIERVKQYLRKDKEK